MTRLAAVLAASVLATACGSSAPCNATISVDWTTFVTADGAVVAACPAGVATMAIYVNGRSAGRFPCSGPAGTISLPQGTNNIDVEALDASDVIYYRDRLVGSASSCGYQGTIDSQPSEGWVDVSYHFAPVDACYTPGPSYIWVRVWDNIANAVAVDSSASPTTDVCGSGPYPISFRLPTGDYTLLSTEEVISSGLAWQPVGANCTHTTFSTTPGAANGAALVPVLADTTTFCP